MKEKLFKIKASESLLNAAAEGTMDGGQRDLSMVRVESLAHGEEIQKTKDHEKNVEDRKGNENWKLRQFEEGHGYEDRQFIHGLWDLRVRWNGNSYEINIIPYYIDNKEKKDEREWKYSASEIGKRAFDISGDASEARKKFSAILKMFEQDERLKKEMPDDFKYRLRERFQRKYK